MEQRLLKYGCNPNQSNARIYTKGKLPIEVISGNPGYINLLDALNGYQLVKELKKTTGIAAAASFKHVSPAGAAVGTPLNETEKRAFFTPEDGLSEVAVAYARARGTDRLCSFGDYIALSDECDESCARIIRREVSDGIIAPSYSKRAVEILQKKRNGSFNIIRIDPDYEPEPVERREVYGITFEQMHNSILIDESMLKDIVTVKKEIPKSAVRDLLIALITLKYTQSNSVCYANGGQTTGVGAGQQSRIHCTRLAGDKTDMFNLRFHEKVLTLPFLPDISRPDRDTVVELFILEDRYIFENWEKYFTVKPDKLTKPEKDEYISKVDGISLASDAFFPFEDNIERAHKSGVRYVVQAGGSIRDRQVIDSADSHGMVMAFCHTRLFHH